MSSIDFQHRINIQQTLESHHTIINMFSTTNTHDETAATAATMTDLVARFRSLEDSDNMALTSGDGSNHHNFLSVPLVCHEQELDNNGKARVSHLYRCLKNHELT